MNIQGTYTNKGLALTAKTAVGACLRVTRVVGGSGHTTDVPNAVQLRRSGRRWRWARPAAQAAPPFCL